MFCNVSWSVTWSITWSSNWYVTWYVMMSHDDEWMSWHWWRRFELEDKFYQTPPQDTINIGSNQNFLSQNVSLLLDSSSWNDCCNDGLLLEWMQQYYEDRHGMALKVFFHTIQWLFLWVSRFWSTYAEVPDISLIFIFENFEKLKNFWLFWRKIWVTTL